MNKAGSDHTNQAFEEYETLAACPVCGAGSIGRVFEPDVALCGECHVYFRNPRPTQEEICRSYDYGSNYAEWQRDDTKRDLLWKQRLKLVKRAKKGGRLLDVGAGDGYFLDMAKAAGYSTYGTEVSSTGASYAEKRGHGLLLGQLG